MSLIDGSLEHAKTNSAVVCTCGSPKSLTDLNKHGAVSILFLYPVLRSQCVTDIIHLH